MDIADVLIGFVFGFVTGIGVVMLTLVWLRRQHEQFSAEVEKLAAALREEGK